MEQNRKGRRILLLPLPLQGHITPMLELAQILCSNGFSITIIHTEFNSPNPSNYPDFTFCPIKDGVDRSDKATMADIPSLLTFLNSSCQDPLEKCLEKQLMMSEEEYDSEHVACLITDDIFHFAQGVAEKMKIPRLVLRTGGVCSFRAFAAFNLLREKGYLPIQDSQLEQEIEELAPLRVKDLPFPIINNSDPEKTYKLIEAMVTSTKRSSGLIFNSFEELEQTSLTLVRNEFPCPVFTVGPFHKLTTKSTDSKDESCIAWLDRQVPGSVIYVSLGSPAAVAETEAVFKEIAWSLSISKRLAVVDVRPGYVSNLLEPAWLGNGKKVDDVVVTKTVAELVLEHPSVGAFLTDSDWDSTLKGISEGVPLISMPCHTDQKVNSRFVSDVWKVGAEVPRDGIERGKIAGIIKGLFEEMEGEEVRSNALAMKKMASDSVSEGGSSQKSIQRLVNHIMSL